VVSLQFIKINVDKKTKEASPSMVMSANDIMSEFKQKKMELAVERYNSLVEKLKEFDKENKVFGDASKKKTPSVHWELGDIIVKFKHDLWKDGIEIENENLQTSLTKSFSGNPKDFFWWEHMNFRIMTPNKEWNDLPWGLGQVLTRTRDEKLRKELEKDMRKNPDKIAIYWEAERNKRMGITPKSRKNNRLLTLEFLRKQDGTEEEIAVKTKQSPHGARGRINELRGYGYTISCSEGRYHLESEPEE
jgi:hypothetical protein